MCGNFLKIASKFEHDFLHDFSGMVILKNTTGPEHCPSIHFPHTNGFC